MAGSPVATITVSIVPMKLLAIIDANANLKAKDLFSTFCSIFCCDVAGISELGKCSIGVLVEALSLGRHSSFILEVGGK